LPRWRHEALQIAVRERLQQNAVDDREDRGGRADRQRERHDDVAA
jgi:hypothetical protein